MNTNRSERVYDEETPVSVKGGNGKIVMSPTAMPPQIKSSPDLLKSLSSGADVEETPEQLDEQKVSFIYGNLPASSLITRDQVAARVVRSRAAA